MKTDDAEQIRRLLRNIRNLIRAALADLDRIAEILCDEECDGDDGE